MSSHSRSAPFLAVVPLPLLLILTALLVAPATGADPRVSADWFARGFGRALGDYALLLIPSFILAGALSRRGVSGAGPIAALLAPFAAAGMVCPDTGYAALSPAAGRYRVRAAFGAFAGFKLLVPAGPLIVAGGLGAADQSLLPLGLALLIPVWAAGEAWIKLVGATPAREEETRERVGPGAWMPLIVAALLMIAGTLGVDAGSPILAFFTQPKGALWIAAIWATLNLPIESRRDCLAGGCRRAADLLLVIGAAGGFGAVLIHLVPLTEWAASAHAGATTITLFVLAAVFKVAQGSSMATFAAVTPVAAPLVAAAGADQTICVFAICLGSMIAILPNDSFYWLARRDLPEGETETRALLLLAGGSIVQASVGLAFLLLISAWI